MTIGMILFTPQSARPVRNEKMHDILIINCEIKTLPNFHEFVSCARHDLLRLKKSESFTPKENADIKSASAYFRHSFVDGVSVQGAVTPHLLDVAR